MTKNDKIKQLIYRYLQRGAIKTFPEENLAYDGVIGDDANVELLYLVKETTATGFKRYLEDYDSKGNGKKKRDKTYREIYPDEFLDYYEQKDAIWDFIKTTNRIIKYPETRFEKVWPILAYWSEAYYDIDKKFKECVSKYEVKEIKDIDYSILSNTAIVNIKKTSGKSISEDEILKKAVDCYGTLIEEEISIIEPNIVMCCGTFVYAKTIYNVNDIEYLDCGAGYFKKLIENKEVYFIEFVHPSCRVTKAATFAYAREIFAELDKRRGRA